MTLAEFALLVGAEPKWVLNTSALLGIRLPYTVANARRVAIARALHGGLTMSLPRAYALAGDAMRVHRNAREPVTLHLDATGTVDVRIDMYRILSDVNIRLSRLRTMYAARRPGRRARRRRDPIATAARYGVDLSLLASNLRRTPAERLRQLDGMSAFVRGIRRKVTTVRTRRV